MKKVYCLFVFVLCFQSLYSQVNVKKDSIEELKEVIIINNSSNRNRMKLILKNIKKSLNDNYFQERVNYYTKHFCVKNGNDTLVNKVLINQLILKRLTDKNIENLMLNDPKNTFHTDVSPFARFEPQTQTKHFFGLSIFYASLGVSDFVFFDISKNYKYKIIEEEYITTIKFTGSKYYSGYFIFNNTNYNLKRVIFINASPYDSYFWGDQANYRKEFVSNWKFNKVIIKLDFIELKDNRFVLSNLDAMQEITNYEFKRYNESNTIIDSGWDLKFYTTLQMKIAE
jgi:hypothetical protein